MSTTSGCRWHCSAQRQAMQTRDALPCSACSLGLCLCRCRLKFAAGRMLQAGRQLITCFRKVLIKIPPRMSRGARQKTREGPQELLAHASSSSAYSSSAE